MRLIDLHCDTIMKLMEDRDRLELRKNDFSVDIEKLRKGNSLAQFFALYIDLENDGDPLERCLAMADKFYLELEKNRNDMALALNYDDIIKNDREGKISALLTIEEGAALKGQLHNLRIFHKLGIRLITLTWNFPNEIGYPNYGGEHESKGLTDFGQEVVSEMNRLGMLIDVSHLSDGGFYDVARLSSKPFVASHSNARVAKNHPRNLTDDMIRVLAEKGGVTGINFAGSFLGVDKRSRVSDMVRHIQHIKNVGGIDVLALGSDYDGITPNLEMENYGEVEKLISALKKSSFSEDEIEKILFKNALRVIKEVL